MGKLVMAYWDCPFCGSQGIRGDVVNCPSCGRARGEVKFYMKDHAENTTREANETGDIEYVDEEKAKTISRNPDWYCSFCNSLNSDNAAFCSNCGATRESSESNYFEMHKKKEEREKAEAAAVAANSSSKPTAAKKGGPKPLLIIAAVVVALVLLFTYLNGNKTSGDLTVSGLYWERAIQVLENIQYSESGWSLPDGAELVSQKQEYHHSDSVLDHYESVEEQRSRRVLDHYETYYTYEDKGNGYYEQVSHERPVYETEYYTETVQKPVYVQVPRYATKYYYTIWRWTPTRTATAKGEDHNTSWPDTDLKENEREGDKAEVYCFTVTDPKKNTTATYRLAEADWMKLNTGDHLYITSKRTGADAYISDKDGNKIADIVQVQ